MVKSLEILTSEEKLERDKTVVIQRAMMLHALDQVREVLETTGEKLQGAGAKMESAFWGLMKVPIVVVVVAGGSLMFWTDKIGEHSWLIIMAVAVFPYLGGSITAIAKLFGLGRRNNGDGK